MKPRPSSAASTWAPAQGGYCGGREGFRGLQKGHHGIKVDTKLTAPKGLLFPLPPRSGGKSLAGRPRSPGQLRAVQPPPRPEEPPARRPGREDPGRVHCPAPSGGRAAPGAGRGLGPREGRRGKGAGQEGASDRAPPTRRWPPTLSGSAWGPGPGAGPVARVPPRVPGPRPCPRPCPRPGVYNPGFATQPALLRRLPPPPGPR